MNASTSPNRFPILRVARTLLVLGVMALACALAPRAAGACTCAGPMSFEQAWSESEAIFVGVVTSIDLVGEDPHWPELRVHFDVSASWRGVTGPTALIATAASGAACGYDFEIGREYLVYADVWSSVEVGTFATHLCHRTHPTFPNDPDIVALGDPPVPAAPATWGAVKATYR